MRLLNPHAIARKFPCLASSGPAALLINAQFPAWFYDLEILFRRGLTI